MIKEDIKLGRFRDISEVLEIISAASVNSTKTMIKPMNTINASQKIKSNTLKKFLVLYQYSPIDPYDSLYDVYWELILQD